MKVKPSQLYRSPNYPTNDIVKQQPAWLKTNIPASWRGKEHIAQMLSVLLFGATMMPNDYIIGDLKLPKEVIARMDSLKIKAVNDDKQAAVLVAPIFEHGEGRGAIGCIVIAPPVFLSEEEARQTIEKEFKKVNIVFDTTNITLDDLVYDKNGNEFIRRDKWNKDVPEGTRSFIIERYDKDNNLGYVYITFGNYFRYGGTDSYSTVQGYDTKAVAEAVSQYLHDYGKVNAVVFYDPLPSMNYGLNMRSADGKEIIDDGTEKAKYLLREQAKDFIKWFEKNTGSVKAK